MPGKVWHRASVPRRSPDPSRAGTRAGTVRTSAHARRPASQPDVAVALDDIRPYQVADRARSRWASPVNGHIARSGSAARACAETQPSGRNRVRDSHARRHARSPGTCTAGPAEYIASSSRSVLSRRRQHGQLAALVTVGGTRWLAMRIWPLRVRCTGQRSAIRSNRDSCSAVSGPVSSRVRSM